MILSALGAALLGFSYLTVGSDMVVVNDYAFDTNAHAWEPFVALCVGDKLVIQTFRNQGGNMNVAGPCPTGETHPVAEVTRDSKSLFFWGWLSVIVSTIWQVYLAARSPD